MEALTKHLSGQPAISELLSRPSRTVTFAEDLNKQPQLSRTTTYEDTVAPPLNRSVTYIPSQVGSPNDSAVSYTSNPLSLLWYDVKLCLTKFPASIGIIMPWRMGADADPFDELYPNLQNIISLTLHTFLIFTQTIFLVSIPFCVFMPVAFFLAWVVIYMAFNSAVSYILNGNKLKVYPSVEVDREGKFSDEYWIFLNGVSVGSVTSQSFTLSHIANRFAERIGFRATLIGFR
jgi:hypothetical protein